MAQPTPAPAEARQELCWGLVRLLEGGRTNSAFGDAGCDAVAVGVCVGGEAEEEDGGGELHCGVLMMGLVGLMGWMLLSLP